MPQATQVNPPVGDDWAVAEKMQVDLATLFDIINRLDVENFNTPGNQFSWNGVQLKNLLDATDTQDAVSLAQLNAAIATAGHGTGSVTQHADVHYDGNDRFNLDNNQGGPVVKSYTVTGDQRAAMDGAATPNAGNPFATMADVPASPSIPGILSHSIFTLINPGGMSPPDFAYSVASANTSMVRMRGHQLTAALTPGGAIEFVFDIRAASAILYGFFVRPDLAGGTWNAVSIGNSMVILWTSSGPVSATVKWDASTRKLWFGPLGWGTFGYEVLVEESKGFL